MFEKKDSDSYEMCKKTKEEKKRATQDQEYTSYIFYFHHDKLFFTK